MGIASVGYLFKLQKLSRKNHCFMKESQIKQEHELCWLWCLTTFRDILKSLAETRRAYSAFLVSWSFLALPDVAACFLQS